MKAATTTLQAHFWSWSGIGGGDTSRSFFDRNKRLKKEVERALFRPHREAKIMPELLGYIEKNQIFMFSFVRHPYDRLVSAYERQFAPGKSDRDVRRSDGKKKKSPKKTFAKFVDRVIKQTSGCVAGKKCDGADVHVRPYYARCAFCDILYEVIGKVETFEEDWRYILKASGLELALAGGGDSSSRVENSRPHTDNRTSVYFGQLSREQRDALARIYSLDAELFGYDLQKYA